TIRQRTAPVSGGSSPGRPAPASASASARWIWQSTETGATRSGCCGPSTTSKPSAFRAMASPWTRPCAPVNNVRATAHSPPARSRFDGREESWQFPPGPTPGRGQSQTIDKRRRSVGGDVADRGVLGDRVARLHRQFPDEAGGRGRDRIFHLHGLDDGDEVAGGHGLAVFHGDANDGSLHRG